MADQPERDAALTSPAPLAAYCSQCGASLATPGTACPRCGAGMTAPGSESDGSDRMRARLQEAIGEGYQLLELLGRGGMGIVFRAREVSLDREVALKVLALDPMLNPDAYQRFEREAKLAARLDHPNIVPIFAVGQRESVAYYTMRLVRGGSVEDLIQRSRQLEYDHVVGVLRDVAAALDYAHGRGVVHRDIKPANILIGETGHAMVADFGIAKALGPSASGATGTGIIGSPGYMSPEQWRGDEIDGRSDQYQLGVVAFEMLTGRRPFETPSVQDLMKLHLTAQVRSVSNYRPGLPEPVDAALRRALAKHASERFSSATGFIDALTGLRPVAVGARTMHGPKFESRKAASRRKRHPILWALLLATTLAGTAFAIPATRPLALRYFTNGRDHSERLLREYGVTWQPPLVQPAAAYDTIRPADDASDSGDGETTEVSIANVEGTDTAPERAPLLTLERQPIGLDTSLYGGGETGFRQARRAEFGFLRVTVQGGAAPVIVDGRELDVTAGPTGRFVRVTPGTHYVSVRGAGVIFQPSQHTVNVGVSDTVALVFTVPSAAPDPTPADSAEPDSTAGSPPGR